MKKLFLALLLFTTVSFGQSSTLLLLMGDEGFQGIYDGDERIFNEIDRGMEVGSGLLLNGTFENYTGTQDDGNTDSFTSWTSISSAGYIDATATVYGGD